METKKVYVLLAEGFELVEAMTPVDVLRRGGAEVITVSVGNSLEVISSQKVIVKADMILDATDLKDGDMLILPGGCPGYENLSNSAEVIDLIKNYAEKSKMIGAICGAPTILAKHSILKGKNITCHTSVASEMNGYNFTGKGIEKDGNLITGMGAGLSLEFSLLLAKSLFKDEIVDKIKIGMEIF